MFPDFIGIGAQKAGTTWLDRNLRVHPQIWMPEEKELHYFDRRIADTGLLNDEWYASIFEPSKGRLAGEITPSYSMLDRSRVAHVHEIMPQAKIIFFMRSPIERAWSQAVMQFSKVEGRTVETVTEQRVRKHFDREGSRSRTAYLRTLENWRRFYPEKQIFVGFLEDVRFFPRDLLRRLYGFLGVDPSFESPDVEQKIHSRSAGKMSTRLAVRLAHLYHDDIWQLHERFGGYASFWLYCAQRLVDEPPQGEHVQYPFWESPHWEEWTSSSGGAALQSGPLSYI